MTNKNEVQKFRPQEQLVLDFFIEQDDDSQKYSQSIELYDAIPKYFWGKVIREEKGFLSSISRPFIHRGTEYEVQIRPASIVKDGVEKYYYPSIREEMVEDALRKLATESRIKPINKRLGLEFSIYELRKELKKAGHSFNHTQITDALKVCSRTGLTLSRTKDKKIMVDQNMFPTLALAEGRGRGGSSLVIVEFNSLVTRSIEQKTFRQINYERSMKISNSLARWLHKRMSHNYRQAQAFHNTYDISLTTIIRDSGMTPYKRLGDSRKYVQRGLEELIKLDVIYLYEEKPKKKGRKLENVTFILKPSNGFSKEMKRANAVMKSI
jgi:hypothetical protein